MATFWVTVSCAGREMLCLSLSLHLFGPERGEPEAAVSAAGDSVSLTTVLGRQVYLQTYFETWR